VTQQTKAFASIHSHGHATHGDFGWCTSFGGKRFMQINDPNVRGPFFLVERFGNDTVVFGFGIFGAKPISLLQNLRNHVVRRRVQYIEVDRSTWGSGLFGLFGQPRQPLFPILGQEAKIPRGRAAVAGRGQDVVAVDRQKQQNEPMQDEQLQAFDKTAVVDGCGVCKGNGRSVHRQDKRVVIRPSVHHPSGHPHEHAVLLGSTWKKKQEGTRSTQSTQSTQSTTPGRCNHGHHQSRTSNTHGPWHGVLPSFPNEQQEQKTNGGGSFGGSEKHADEKSKHYANVGPKHHAQPHQQHVVFEKILQTDQGPKTINQTQYDDVFQYFQSVRRQPIDVAR